MSAVLEPPVVPSAGRRILLALLALTFLSGLVNGIAHEQGVPEPPLWTLFGSVLSSFLSFCWYVQDRNARGVRASMWANIAILLLGPLALMVYLGVSRPRGRKLRAIGRLFGFLLLMLAAALVGAILAAIGATMGLVSTL